MYLRVLRLALGRAFFRQISASVALAGLWLFLLAGLVPAPVARAASEVRYSISPTTSSVQPNSTVDITVTLHTDVNLSGGSVHVAFQNGSYAGFASAESSAFTFVYYHPTPNDMLFICSNNNCQPGSYPIGTITAKSGQSGNMQVTFTPKETADPQLNLMPADGASGTYDITAIAPPSPPQKTTKNTYSIPQSNEEDGLIPLLVDDEQLVDRVEQAEETAQVEDETIDEKFWTPTKIFLISMGVGAGFAGFTFLFFKFFMGPPGPKGPTNYNGPGTTFTPSSGV